MFSISQKIEADRILVGAYGSSPHDPFGAFMTMGPCGALLVIIASDGTAPEVEGWEHVSVSIKNRPPNWREMCWVKDRFWEVEDVVVQFHPPLSQYVNVHPNCLHLWRLADGKFPCPPARLVGPKAYGREIAAPGDAAMAKTDHPQQGANTHG